MDRVFRVGPRADPRIVLAPVLRPIAPDLALDPVPVLAPVSDLLHIVEAGVLVLAPHLVRVPVLRIVLIPVVLMLLLLARVPVRPRIAVDRDLLKVAQAVNVVKAVLPVADLPSGGINPLFEVDDRLPPLFKFVSFVRL